MPTPQLRSDFVDARPPDSDELPASEYNLNAQRTDAAYAAITGETGNAINVLQRHPGIGSGTVDAAAAINETILAVQTAGGGTVYLPPANYRLDSTIGRGTTAVQGVELVGVYGQTRLFSGGAHSPLTGSWYRSKIHGLTLDAQNGGAGANIHMVESVLAECLVINWVGFGLRLNDGTYGDLGLLNWVQRNHIVESADTTGVGIYQTYRWVDSWLTDNNVGSKGANLSLEDGPLRILGNHLNGAPRHNIELRGNKRITISGNILEGSRREAIVYTMPGWLDADEPHIQIVGNALSNGGKEAAGTYPAIRFTGVDADSRVAGFLVAGNTVSCDDAEAGWSYVVAATHADDLAITGNEWATGHDEAAAVSAAGCNRVVVFGNSDGNTSGGGGSGPASTDELTEGSVNRYFTDSRADARVSAGIAALIGAAPADLDTWIELVAQITENESGIAGIITALAGKQAAFKTGTVSTAMATVAKTVTLDSPWASATPAVGDFLLLTMTNGNSTQNTTLAVNGGAARPIKTPAGISIAEALWMQAGARQLFIYDGTNYQMVGANTFYNEVGEANLVNTASQVLGLMSGRRAEYLMANEATETRTLQGKTIDGDLNTLADINIASLKATGTRDATTYLAGDGTWKTMPSEGSGSASVVEFNEGTGTWPDRPDVDFPVFWVGGDAPDDAPPATETNDVWFPATGDSVSLGEVLEAIALLPGTAGSVPYFTGPGTAGELTVVTDITGTSDTALVTEGAVARYVSKLPVLTYTAARTLDADNIGKMNEYNNSTDATFTLGSGVMTEGDVMYFRTIGSGTLTIAGTGVVSKGNKLKLTGQYTEAVLHCRASGAYVLTGDLSA